MDAVLDQLVIGAAVFLFVVAIFGSWAWCAAWVVRDSRRRGQPGWALPLVVLCGPFAAIAWLIIWLVVRPKRTLTEKQPREYQSASDAFLAASQLDVQGEWDAAIALYQDAAERWPEHGVYAENSIEHIRKRQL